MYSHVRAFNYYKRVVCLAGLLVFVGTVVHVGPHLENPLELAIFFFLIFLTELHPIRFPGTFADFSMTMPAVVGLFLSHGPSVMLLVSATSIFAANLITRRGKPIRWLLDVVSYNTADYIVSVTVASFTYTLVGGGTLAGGGAVTFSATVLPLLVWVAACTTTNMLLFTTSLSLYSREPWRMLMMQNLRWFVPNYVVTGPSGILFAYLYLKYDVYGILLVIVPFLVGRQALNQYAVQLDAYRETVTTLGVYMQHYHPYTRGHLERVAGLADEVGKRMGLPASSLMFIRDAGLLHDIGKVGVNEEILDKVGHLTDEEWAVIKQHPARGAEILSQMKYLERIVPWVRGHHERPDGRGYPDGLQNGDIPLEAAVIAVADAFDAMTGGPDETDRRIYRAPLTLDQAVAQLRYGVGTQFDPRVVRAFLRVVAREEQESGG